MPTSTRPYRGISGEQRRSNRRSSLIEAGLDLLGTEGWARTTVTAVCSRARLTERYFYESFPDREALLLAVFDHVTEEVTRVVFGAVQRAPDDARAKAHAAIESLVLLLTDDPRKGRVAMLEAMGSEALQHRRLETLQGFARLVSEEMRAFYGPAGPPREKAELTALILLGGLAEILIAWLGGTVDVSREQLVEHATHVFVAAVEGTSGRPRPAEWA